MKQESQGSSPSSEIPPVPPRICPLSRVQAGTVVCVKQLTATPVVTNRLRELGLRERQHIRLVARESSYICQICNARLAISSQLAESILVESPGSLVPED